VKLQDGCMLMLNRLISHHFKIKHVSFVISNACRTAQFNLATSFGNRMMLTADKGAIGFIGCQTTHYWHEDFYWAVGPELFQQIRHMKEKGLEHMTGMFHTHGESPSDWYFTMGQINYAGNLAVSASNSSNKKYYWEAYNLVGTQALFQFWEHLVP